MRLASLSTFVHCKVTHSSAGNTHYLCMCNNIAQVQSANSLFKFEIRWHTSSAAMIYCIAFINDVRYYHGNSTPYVAVCQTARVAQLTQPCQYRQHSLHMLSRVNNLISARGFQNIKKFLTWQFNNLRTVMAKAQDLKQQNFFQKLPSNSEPDTNKKSPGCLRNQYEMKQHSNL